jgi:hypothetical protein
MSQPQERRPGRGDRGGETSNGALGHQSSHPKWADAARRNDLLILQWAAGHPVDFQRRVVLT